MGVEENQVSGAREQHLRKGENKVREVGGEAGEAKGEEGGRRERKRDEGENKAWGGERREGKLRSSVYLFQERLGLGPLLCVL